MVLALLATATPQRPAAAQPSAVKQEEGRHVGGIYQDISLRKEPGRLVFRNSRLTLEFDRTGGQWLSLRYRGLPGSLIRPARPDLGLDFRIDGQWMVETRGARLLRHQVAIDPERSGASLCFTYGVLSRGAAEARPGAPPSGGSGGPAAYEYELTSIYTLHPKSGALVRQARLARMSGSGDEDAGVRKLQEFRFVLPGVSLGEPADCRIDVPGPWFPATYVAPETPFQALKDRTITFHGAPDGGFGVLAMSNPRLGASLITWMDTGAETGCGPALGGDGERLHFAFTDHRAYRMPEGLTVDSDLHRTEVVEGPLPRALARYRAWVSRRLPPDPRTPDWVRDMVLLEVYPPYFPGGFSEIAGKLSFYREVGFNAVYLMPHWVGGYSPLDLYRVDPAFGTAEDLKALVREAHRLGMRVLFDMVIHGFNEKSPVPQERPDLFVHDEQGGIARHPTWKSLSTDWASPAYQQYMADLVLHDLKEYDIDGYRVDAASYKGPNWDPRIPYPAYRSGSASAELMRRMVAALRERKPAAVLLSEVVGPVFYTASNLVHDNQTEAVQQLLEKMEAGQATPADYKAHLANVHDLLPAGANRVYFARNHDTSWFYHFNGYTPRFLAMDAIHTLCAIPEVFAGDPRNGPNPDDDPSVWSYYRKLFAARARWPELTRGDLLLREVDCDSPWVFTALRRLGDHLSLVVVSLSDKPEEVSATIATPDPGPRGRTVSLLDPIAGGETAVRQEEGGTLRLRLEPFQVLVGRLR